jgi:hypothetical protein
VQNFDIFSQDGHDLSNAGERPKTFSECMDNLCQLFVDGKRPQKVVVDQGGFYIDSANPRVSDIFDFFSEYSVMTITPFPTGGDIGEVGQIIPLDVLPQIVESYLKDFNNRLGDIVSADGHIRKAFVHGFKGDNSGAVEEFYKWLSSCLMIRDRSFED